jgi:hypothetical protein
MKSFKAYLKDDKKPKPSMETSMGSHSLPKEKKIVKEDRDSRPNFDEGTPEHHDHIHGKVAKENTSKLSVGERNAIHHYTRGSLALNTALHKHHTKGTPLTDDEHEHATQLSNAMHKHKTSEDIHVYTGLKKSPVEHFNAPKENAKVHLPAYTSTSSSQKTASNFASDSTHKNDKHHDVKHNPEWGAQHILKLHVPKGTHAVSVKKRSEFEHEHEVTLDRGHDIEIHHTPEHLGNNVYQWHGKIVGHTPAKLKKE